jgi:hypothetical protein
MRLDSPYMLNRVTVIGLFYGIRIFTFILVSFVSFSHALDFISDRKYNEVYTSIRPHCGPGVNSASNTKEYQGYLLGKGDKDERYVGPTILPP